jgi:hypothetical protein
LIQRLKKYTDISCKHTQQIGKNHSFEQQSWQTVETAVKNTNTVKRGTLRTEKEELKDCASALRELHANEIETAITTKFTNSSTVERTTDRWPHPWENRKRQQEKQAWWPGLRVPTREEETERKTRSGEGQRQSRDQAHPVTWCAGSSWEPCVRGVLGKSIRVETLRSAHEDKARDCHNEV